MTLLRLAHNPTIIAVLLTLMDRYAGRTIPRAPLHVERDRQIRAALDAGETYAEVAVRFGLSSARVVQIGKAR